MGCFTFITVLDILIFLGIIFCRGATLFDKWGGGGVHFYGSEGLASLLGGWGRVSVFMEVFSKKNHGMRRAPPPIAQTLGNPS